MRKLITGSPKRLNIRKGKLFFSSCVCLDVLLNLPIIRLLFLAMTPFIYFFIGLCNITEMPCIDRWIKMLTDLFYGKVSAQNDCF